MGLAMVFRYIKDQTYVFPRWPDFEPFADDFTCIFEDYNTTLRCIIYDHPVDLPDDSCHSLLFATMALKIAMGNKALN